ncbi:DUF3604 domain-containing protein [Halomontanus rarus]|uniref:DUF3604 domain-containing protein n=1 Tax=Halomontanus rarus TaxID=3034020 RepID=UPI0023E7CF70|nr:DUF3604 domain-containing protein [Halovivax sp. TS33]
MAPRRFEDNDHWYEQTRTLQHTSPVDDVATIDPDRVEAYRAPREWRVTYEVREEPLRAGDHVAMEIPLYFRLDHGRPYPVGTTHVEHVDDANPGYAAAVDVETPSDNVELRFAITHTSRLSILDVEVEVGAIQVGDALTITLGDEGSSRLRAPSFSQRFRFATGVSRGGDGTYRPLAAEPVVDVHGAAAKSHRIVAPSTVEVGESFDVDVFPADEYNHNPAAEYDGTALLEAPEFVDAPPDLAFAATGETLVARAREALLDDTYSFEATASADGCGTFATIDRENGIFGQSNPVATGWSERDVYWGDIHVQGYDSIGVGTAAEMFEWGRNVEALDFCATANHYGGRYEVTPAVWNRVVEASNRYDDPGEFAALISYEWSGEYGHRNVYFRDDEGAFFGSSGTTSHYEEADTMEELWTMLDAYDGEALAFPHHPKFCGPGRTSWDRFHDEYQRLVEIYSAWGDSEAGGPWSVRAGLRRGHRVGFTGGTDTHEGQPGTGTHEFGKGAGKTAIYADELTRDGVFEALAERRTYATTGPRILLKTDCNGLRMGAERSATDADRHSRTVTARTVGTAPVTAIDVIRNGEVVATFEPEERDATVEWTDDDLLNDVLQPRDHPDGRDSAFYYVRVTQADRHRAWASPVWFLE